MRCVAVIVLFCVAIIFNNSDARIIPRKFSKNLKNSIHNTCNKEAYTITSNNEMYNCMKVNNSQNCRHIENFTDYINTKNICIDKSNSAVGLGIFISIIGWIIIPFLFHR